MASSSEPALPHAVALAWGVAANPQRGPKRELSIERIVETAIALADDEGLGAVSMARVAQELGYTTMSLYRYVTSKDDLLQLMQDEVGGFEMPPIQDTDWRGGLRSWAKLTMAQLGKHPWFTELPITGIPLMPNQLRVLEAGLDTLRSTPLTGQEKLATILVVANHARVVVAIQHQIASAGVTPSEASGEAYAEALSTLITAETYPEIHRLLAAGELTDQDFDDAAFGLERILDGIEAYLRALPERPAAPAAEDVTAVYAKDPKVADAARARREAEKALREAVKREREAVAHAQEKAREAAKRDAERAKRDAERARRDAERAARDATRT